MVTQKQNFNEIYEKYKNLVLKTAYRYSGNYSSADDITQETFLALYKDMQKKERMSEEQYTNIKAWLITTAKHKAINQSKQVEREISLFDAEKNIEAEDPEDCLFEGFKEKETIDLHERIMTSLLKKNERWHEAVFLACYLGMNQDEAAKQMSIEKGAFYLLLHRARTWIRKEFGVEYKELKKY